MRHKKHHASLGVTREHRAAMLSNMGASLIEHGRIQTTLAKAKAARSVAEKMVTLGKSGTLADRRLATGRLHNADAAKILFTEVAPMFKSRSGGYTRILQLHQRNGDAVHLAILEWVDTAAEAAPVETTDEKKKTEAKDSDTKKAGAKKAKKDA